MFCGILAMRVRDDSGSNENPYRQALRPHTSLDDLLRSRLMSKEDKSVGDQAVWRIAEPITHDDGTGDCHAGSPAAHYDLVLMAGDPF